MRFDGPYLIDHGDVWFGEHRAHVCDGTQMLGVAFDREDGTLHKHGEASRVSAWADTTRAKLVASGLVELAEGLTVVQFGVAPETVEEINACIAISGRAATLIDRLPAIAPQPAPWIKGFG